IIDRAECKQCRDRRGRRQIWFQQQHHQRLENSQSAWYVTDLSRELREKKCAEEWQEPETTSRRQKRVEHRASSCPIERRDGELHRRRAKRRYWKFPTADAQRPALRGTPGDIRGDDCEKQHANRPENSVW